MRQATEDRYTVRVTRPNGSVTFKGARMTLAAARREADAWLGLDQGYGAEVVTVRDSAPEVRAWRRVVATGAVFMGAAVASACSAPGVPAELDLRPACGAGPVVVDTAWDDSTGSWVDSPLPCSDFGAQRLDLRYTLTAAGTLERAAADCDHAGGTFVATAGSTTTSGGVVTYTAPAATCQGIDN